MRLLAIILISTCALAASASPNSMGELMHEGMRHLASKLVSDDVDYELLSWQQIKEHPKMQPAEGELEAATAVEGASVGTQPMVFIPHLAALFRPDDLKTGTKHNWATPCFDSTTAAVTKWDSESVTVSFTVDSPKRNYLLCAQNYLLYGMGGGHSWLHLEGKPAKTYNMTHTWVSPKEYNRTSMAGLRALYFPTGGLAQTGLSIYNTANLMAPMGGGTRTVAQQDALTIGWLKPVESPQNTPEH